MTTFTAPPNQNGLVLNNGDILNVNSGGVAGGVTIVNDGAIVNVNSGGVTNQLVVINDGGIVNVNAGGATNGTLIDGVENVAGTASGSRLDRGGVENVLSGGSTNVDFEGGTLTLVDPNGLSSQDPGSEWQNLSAPVRIDFKNMIVSSATMTFVPQDGFLTVNISGQEYNYEFFMPTEGSSGNFPVQLASDGNGGTLVSFVENTLSSPAFSPETAGTIVYTAEFGSAPSATELNVLNQFTQVQFAYGQQIGVQDPSIYAFQALGVALASGPHFQDTFGPTNTLYPVSTVGEVHFVDAAYASVFGHTGNAAQIEVFVDQLNSFEALYTAAGVFGSQSNIDLLARGAIYGQMLGIEQESELGSSPPGPVTPGPVFDLTQGQDTIALDQSGSAVTGTFGAADATWTPGDTITAAPGTTDQSFDIQGIGGAGVIDVTSVPGNHVSGVQNVNISANTAASGFSDQAVHGDFTATGPEGAWSGLAQLVVDSAGNQVGADNLTVGPDTAVQITDTLTAATSEALTVNGSSTTTITENNLAPNTGITVNGGSGTTAVSITQTETAVGNDGIVNIVDVNGASKTDADTITKIVLDGLSHFTLNTNQGDGDDVGPNNIIDNALTDLTVNNSDTTQGEYFLAAVGLIITDNLTIPTATTLNLSLGHDGINAAGTAASTLAITDLNNAYSTVHLSLGAEDSALLLNFNGLITLDTPEAGTGALLGNPINPSGMIDDVAAAINFNFSGLNGPNDIAVVRETTTAYTDVYTLGNFGTDNGFFGNGNVNGLFQQLEIDNENADNTDTFNFGSGAYIIIMNAAIPGASHNYVQTAANGAGLANLNTGAQWAKINNAHGGGNSDTLTFQTDNAQKFVNLGELGGSASAISGISAGIGEALNTSAHTVVEFTFAGNTFIFDHADGSFALTPADAMVELTGIHPIAAINAAHEITFAT